jgi:hypothetical protein
MRHRDRAKRARRTSRPSLSFAIVLATALFASTPRADAGDSAITVAEVSPPPPSFGIDAAMLRAAAEGEIRQIDVSRLPKHRPVLVAFALTRAVVQGPIDCTVNAMVRDAKTGTMIAIIEGGAHADGPPSAELRKQVAHAAVRNAVRRIPLALGAK